MTDRQIKDTCLQIMETAHAAYLTTLDPARGPQTRAMLNLRNLRQYPGLAFLSQPAGSRFDVYFTTNAASRKLPQIAGDPRASAYFCLPDQWQGFMIGGGIEIVGDAKLKDSIWQDGWETYYARGRTDPDYAVLRLRPEYLKGWLGSFTFDIALRQPE